MHCTVKNKILATASILFRKFGFKSVTVDDIAKETGISKKTLYENIADKDELVLLTLQEQLTNIYNRIKTIQENSKNAIEEMIQVIQLMEDELSSQNPVGHIDLQRYYPNSFSFKNEFLTTKMKSILITNLQNGIAQNLYRASINVEITANCRMENLSNMVNASNGTAKEMAKIQRESMEQFLYGISTLKGFKMIEKKLQNLA